MYTKALVAALAARAVATVFEVEVGESGLEFTPNTITAQPGDSVAFILYPVHNVVSGSHNQPCIFNETSGFFSGTPDFDGGPAAERFVVDITSNDPIWFFCAISGHCQDGMVGVINAPAGGDTLTEYRNGASSASRATTPSGGMTGGRLLDAAGVAALSSAAPSASPSAAESSAAQSSAAESSAAQSSAAESSAAQSSAAQSSAAGSSAAQSSAAMTSGTSASRPAQSGTGAAPAPTSTGGAAFENPQAIGSSTVLAFIAGVAAWFL